MYLSKYNYVQRLPNILFLSNKPSSGAWVRRVNSGNACTAFSNFFNKSQYECGERRSSAFSGFIANSHTLDTCQVFIETLIIRGTLIG